MEGDPHVTISFPPRTSQETRIIHLIKPTFPDRLWKPAIVEGTSTDVVREDYSSSSNADNALPLPLPHLLRILHLHPGLKERPECQHPVLNSRPGEERPFAAQHLRPAATITTTPLTTPSTLPTPPVHARPSPPPTLSEPNRHLRPPQHPRRPGKSSLRR